LGENRDIKGAFSVSIDEVSRRIKNLDFMVEDHEALKADLWRE